MQYWQHLPKIDYPQVMIEAGAYPSKNKLLDYGVGLIDATILMHGIKNQSPIWTLDTKFLRIIPRELIFSGEYGNGYSEKYR